MRYCLEIALLVLGDLSELRGPKANGQHCRYMRTPAREPAYLWLPFPEL